MKCGIVTRSELVQKCQQLAVCAVSTGTTVDRRGSGKDLLSQRQIGIEVDLCSLDRLVPEPQGDRSLFDARME